MSAHNDLHNAVFIIDGSSFLYRAYYSIRPLSSPDGLPVQAVYGFCRMIKRLIDTYNPSHVALVWDSKGKTTRHEIFPEYKATRQAPPSDLFEQKQLILEFADLIGLKQVSVTGIEADDLMYSIAKQIEQSGGKAVLVTSDKDLGQAVSDAIILLDPFKDEFIDKAKLEAKFQFPVYKLPFYFSLIGDASDNIPGVKGIGPKGATDLVQQFESLEDLYAHITMVKSARTQQLLIASKEDAFLSEKLFLLRYIAPETTLESYVFNAQEWTNANPLFIKLGFKSFLKAGEFENAQPLRIIPKYHYQGVATEAELFNLIELIKQKKQCAIDTEGTSLSPLEGELVGISICVEEGTAYYIAFGHKTPDVQLPRALVIDQLKIVLEDASISKYLHHAKFDALMLHHAGINLQGITFDTMIAANLLITDGQRAGLKYLSEYYLQEPMLTFNEMVKDKKLKDFSYVPVPDAIQYAAADAHQTWRLNALFTPQIKSHNLEALFYDIEMPLLRILIEMEKEGISFNTEKIKPISEQVTIEISMLHNQILDLIGPGFVDINLNSPKQLEDLLFNHLKLPVIKKTTQKTAYSTDQEVLKDLAKIHPVPALIARYRELFKLKTTYLDALGTYINPNTRKIHTTFSQTQVATGRLSSSEPNLQNIPVDRYHMRKAFEAEQDAIFLSADYSQIELRVLAFLSQDATLLEAFKHNYDIHALTASGLFEVPLENVTHEQRQLGKRINFSILYGLTPHGLSKDLDISYATAKKYIDKFMSQYPGVRAWMESVVTETIEKGYVTTYWGRRRYIPAIKEKNRNLFDAGKRAAINTKAQGTAAELMKIGMINLNSYLKEKKSLSKIILQIHDELLIQVPIDEILVVEKMVIDVLESVVSWNVPLVVTTRTGRDWQEVTK